MEKPVDASIQQWCSLYHSKRKSKGITADHIPIVYNKKVNITFFGLQKLHSFDPEKYRHVVTLLLNNKIIQSKSQLIPQHRIHGKQLMELHTKEYIKTTLKTPVELAQICEFPPLALAPMPLLTSKLLKPMKYHVGGTILAGELALKYKFAIHLGGGMHHASFDSGGGWCVYSDISLSIQNLMKQGKITTAAIIDLDVHQGNGHERFVVLLL